MRRINLSVGSVVSRSVGFSLGAALVVLALAGWRIPRGTGTAGADVQISALATGEFAVDPTGSIVNAIDLRPGRGGTGGFGIVNQTGKALRVRLRALPDSRELDDVLHVSVRTAGGPLYDGMLGGLRAWTTKPLVVGYRRKAAFSIQIEIPATIDSGWQGQSESVPLELDARPAQKPGSG